MNPTTTPPPTDALDAVRQRFIEAAGHLTQSFGAGKILGQIFAFVYLHKTPCSLTDMTAALSISKGSASTCVRQLEHWGALRKVWVKGDRKDFYEASAEFGHILRAVMRDTASRIIQNSSSLISEAESALAQVPSGTTPEAAEELEFVRKRISLFALFRDRSFKIWNNRIFQALLKSSK